MHIKHYLRNFLPINCASFILFISHCRAFKTFICKKPRVKKGSDKKGRTERKDQCS